MKLRLALIALILTVAASSALADTFGFTFTSSSNVLLAQGTLSATPNGDGSYVVTTGSLTLSLGALDDGIGDSIPAGTYDLLPNPNLDPHTIALSPSGAFY